MAEPEQSAKPRATMDLVYEAKDAYDRQRLYELVVKEIDARNTTFKLATDKQEITDRSVIKTGEMQHDQMKHRRFGWLAWSLGLVALTYLFAFAVGFRL